MLNRGTTYRADQLKYDKPNNKSSKDYYVKSRQGRNRWIQQHHFGRIIRVNKKVCQSVSARSWIFLNMLFQFRTFKIHVSRATTHATSRSREQTVVPSGEPLDRGFTMHFSLLIFLARTTWRRSDPKRCWIASFGLFKYSLLTYLITLPVGFLMKGVCAGIMQTQASFALKNTCFLTRGGDLVKQ